MNPAVETAAPPAAPSHSYPPGVGSPWRAFFALVLFAFRRQLRVRQMAAVAFGLLALMAAVVAIITTGPIGWRLENRERHVLLFNKNDTVLMSYREYGEDRLTFLEAFPGPPDAFGLKVAVFDSFRAITTDTRYLDDWAFLHFSRWTVFALFLGFLMPLFNLAYATDSLGSERESRTLIWLLTRPLPRWAVYAGKFLGVLPWCVGVSLLAFVVLCLAGGELGRKAMAVYWPAVLAGSLGFAALFHLIGALFRRPAVIGLVYVFFYETLVANIPGSLKQLSLSYYVRSMFYNITLKLSPAVQPESVDVYAPADTTTAWVAIIGATVALTGLGMYLFGRQEPKDET